MDTNIYDISSLKQATQEPAPEATPQAEATPTETPTPTEQPTQEQTPAEPVANVEPTEVVETQPTTPVETPVAEEPKKEVGNVDEILSNHIKELEEKGDYISKAKFEEELKKSQLNKEIIEKELRKSVESLDTDNLNQAKELAVQSLMEKEGLPKHLAEMKLEQNYPNLFETDPDTESKDYKYEQELLKHQANSYKESRLSKLDEMLAQAAKPQEEFDTEKVKQEYAKQIQEEQIKANQQFVDSWKSYAENDVTKGLTDKTYKIGDNEFKVTFEAEDLQKIQTFTQSVPNFINSQFTTDGNFDSNKFQEFAIKATLFDKISERLVSDALALGEQKQFKETKNAQPTSNTTPKETKPKQSTNDWLQKMESQGLIK